MKGKKGFVFIGLIALFIIFLFIWAVAHFALKSLPWVVGIIVLYLLLKFLIKLMKDTKPTSSPKKTSSQCNALYKTKEEIDKCMKGEL